MEDFSRDATSQAEKFFLTFYKNFPDFSKSNFYFKLILKYIIKLLKLNIKFLILFYYRLKQKFFFAELNNITSIWSPQF